MSRHFSQPTVAACVFRGHETPAHGRGGCPLVQALIRRVNDLELADEPNYAEHELEKYRAVARVLDCPVVAKLAVQDLRALVAARQISWLMRSPRDARSSPPPTPRAPLQRSAPQSRDR
jgi:hypothetical protein